MKTFWLGIALCLLAPAAQAQAPSPAATWFRAGHVTLRLTDAAADFRATWRFDRADNGDNRILREEQRGSTRIDGEVMAICDDQALLLHDIRPERTHELRELDGPLMYLQLTLRLLARALPEGVSVAAAGRSFELKEPAAPIRTRRGAESRRDFNAPWQARGRVTREADGGIAFEIAFDYAGDAASAPRTALQLSGVWREDSAVRRFDDATDIAAWQVYRINAVPVTTAGNVHFEAMAATKPLRYATLGHLRRHIERAWSPNPKVKPIMECKS